VVLGTQVVQAIIMGIAVYLFQREIKKVGSNFDYCTFFIHFLLFLCYIGLLVEVRMWNHRSAEGLKAQTFSSP
jgi:hypothetical protein